MTQQGAAALVRHIDDLLHTNRLFDRLRHRSQDLERERERGRRRMRPSKQGPPPWEVILLVSHYLEPKTLALASCVCKSWYQALSSDHLWKPICLTSYPCSSHLLASGLSPYQLFSLFYGASKRRYIHPSLVCLSLDQLFFTIEIFHCQETLVSVMKPGEELVPNKDGTFSFEIDMMDQNVEIRDGNETGKEITVGWTIVMRGFERAFALMEREGRGRMIADLSRIWYHEKLPVPGCCKGLMSESAGIEAEMTVEIRRVENGKNGVKKVSVGLMSGCRYVGFEDGLRYLQYFLLDRDRI
ncbi:hypothetical protein LUZ60_011177 [Juncus effusus]|nr:hypothetical protein LUZ60_011177 [Juncus effusus]